MYRATVKNTFLTIEMEEGTDSRLMGAMRSRSSEPGIENRTPSSRNGPMEARSFDALARLNAMLVDKQSGDETPIKKQPEETAAELDDLRKLQHMLGQALAVPAAQKAPTMGLKFPDKHRPANESNTSISTMAEDDTSECGGDMNLKRIRKIQSSGSVSTMMSDWNDSFGEPDEEVRSTRGAPLREDFCHSLVPKNHNFAEMYRNSAADEPPTTLMIRNIPSRYTQNDLMVDMKDKGLGGVYDFLYMPMDKGTSTNVGYAFVNFIHPSYAQTCMQLFQGHRFKRPRSGGKIASVSVAHIQGLEKNMQHYENSAVNSSKATRRPMIIANLAGMVQ